MIYIFDEVGKAICKMSIFYKDISEVVDSVNQTMTSLGGTCFRESELNYGIDLVYLKDDQVKAAKEKPDGDYVFDINSEEWVINQPEVYRRSLIRRNILLDKSDYTQYPDVQESMPEEKKNEWKEYRKKLRDFPLDYDGLIGYQWPVKPE